MKNKAKETKKVKGKVLEGVVVSVKMENTIIVAVTVRKAHPFYGKIMSSTKKYKAHTEEKLRVGDKVRIIQSTPISKEKKWKVLETVK